MLSIAYLSGFILWLLDRRENPEFFPSSYIKGTFESFWWAFITMTTLGYGDRYPLTFKGRIFAIIWMLMGIVLYGMLLSYLSSALTTRTITYANDVSSQQIAAIQNSPEFQLGKRLNLHMNKEVQPGSFQELYDALIQKKVDGALIDGYVIGKQKHLFQRPNLKFSKMFDVKPAYGIVLGGNSSRLRTCFYGYLQAKRAEIFKRIAAATETFEIEEEVSSPLVVQFTTNLFKPETPAFKRTVYALSASLAVLVFFGCIYTYRRRVSTKATKYSNYKKDIQMLRKDVNDFCKNMIQIGEKLRRKHARELRQYLDFQKKKKKTGP